MAATIGIRESEFWTMLPREFMRIVEAHREDQEARAKLEEHRFYNTLNAVGAAFNGKKWKWQTPTHEAEEVEGFEEREARALRRHRARHARKQAA